MSHSKSGSFKLQAQPGPKMGHVKPKVAVCTAVILPVMFLWTNLIWREVRLIQWCDMMLLYWPDMTSMRDSKLCDDLSLTHPVWPSTFVVAVLRVMRPGEDGASCVLQGSGRSRGSWEPVLCREQAAGHPSLWGERLRSSLAEPRVGEGEAFHGV